MAVPPLLAAPDSRLTPQAGRRGRQRHAGGKLGDAGPTREEYEEYRGRKGADADKARIFTRKDGRSIGGRGEAVRADAGATPPL